LKAAAEAVKDLDLGTSERVSFGADRHQAGNGVYFTVVNGDQFVPLDDWTRWRR
jgi:hypothetical protein